MLHRISNPQLISLFILSRMFSDCMNFPNTVAEYGMQRFTATLISSVILFALYIPLMIFCLKHQGESIFTVFSRRCRPLLYIAGIPLILLFAFEILVSIVQLDFFATSTLMKTVPSFVIIGLMTLTLLYGATKGIQASARMAPVVLVAFICFLTPASIYLLKQSNFNFLYPAFIDNPGSFWWDIMVDVAKNSEVFALLALCRYTNKKAARTIFAYVPAVLFLIEFMTLLSVVRLGPAMDSFGFPYNRLATLVNIEVLERFDGIDMFIWTCAAVLKMTMFLLVIIEILSFIMKEKAAKIVTMIITAGLGTGGYFFSIYHHLLIAVDYSWVIVLCLLIFGVIAPVIAIILERKRNGEKADNDSVPNLGTAAP